MTLAVEEPKARTSIIIDNDSQFEDTETIRRKGVDQYENIEVDFPMCSTVLNHFISGINGAIQECGGKKSITIESLRI